MEKESNIQAKLDFENKTSDEFCTQDFEKLLENVLILEKKTGEICLILVDDETSKTLNRKFRGKNSRTDVLSFASEMPGFLGDIYIDISVARQQKQERTLKNEVQILFLHGLLHLLGYKHNSNAQKKNMDKKMKEYSLKFIKKKGVN